MTEQKILDVNLTDHFDYDVPGDLPAYAWIEKHASYKGTSNGQDGVWDFIINVDSIMENEDVPEELFPILSKAADSGVAYILFHQGT